MADHIKPGTEAARIRAKRRASGVGRLTAKEAAGDSHGDERVLVRVGKVNTRVLTGAEDLSEWDEEELRRGQRRDKNGAFQGRAPVIVPKVIHDELVRRTISKANKLMNENLYAAVEVLTEIVTGQDIEAKDKLRAIAMIMDRTMGKTPDKVEVSGEVPPWQVAIQAGIVTINSDKLGGTPEGEELDGMEVDE